METLSNVFKFWYGLGKSLLPIIGFIAIVFVLAIIWARHTSYITTGADVPVDMPCVRDTFPDANHRTYDHKPRWLKAKKNFK